MRDGSPMPDTGVINTVTLTDNTRTVIFTPSKGEVHQFLGISGVTSGGSGSRVYQLYLGDGAGKLVLFYYYSTTDTNIILSGDTNYPDFPLFLTSNMMMQISVDGTYDSSVISLATIRVR